MQHTSSVVVDSLFIVLPLIALCLALIFILKLFVYL